METRVCKKCKVEKKILEFTKELNKKQNRYFYRHRCRECRNHYFREKTKNKKQTINKNSICHKNGLYTFNELIQLINGGASK